MGHLGTRNGDHEVDLVVEGPEDQVLAIGPVTLNSRGGMYVRLPGGLNFQGRWKKEVAGIQTEPGRVKTQPGYSAAFMA